VTFPEVAIVQRRMHHGSKVSMLFFIDSCSAIFYVDGLCSLFSCSAASASSAANYFAAPAAAAPAATAGSPGCPSRSRTYMGSGTLGLEAWWLCVGQRPLVQTTPAEGRMGKGPLGPGRCSRMAMDPRTLEALDAEERRPEKESPFFFQGSWTIHFTEMTTLLIH